ncbi:rhodanese-like domain-containing protein [Bacteroides coprosuis]|uniref:rhodanese-like domain-containing protein n=1 Tax=Bacteroides coprosuis TaxID=151276 RepID=UPI001D27F0C4|nr:rhodanese-like domain-containing protein [Bacteroides coprosuis]HJD92426.1 rhodanese-like domain-containing protein [Bacteroides coprosuis]
MKYIVTAFTLSLLMFSCQRETTYTSLNTNDFKDVIENLEVQLLDVRTIDEFNSGHISDAEFIDFPDSLFIEKADSMFNKKQTIAVYCRTGRRSKKAADLLIKHGFKVIELDSGITNWIEKDFPIVEQK